MECQDVRMLLTFSQRGCENLAHSELAAIQQHLEACPECSASAQADLHLDASLGQIMRDVAIPDGLKERMLNHLAAHKAAQPRRVPWKWMAAAAVAASVALIGLGGGLWYLHPFPDVSFADVEYHVSRGSGESETKLEEDFAKQGVEVHIPRMLDYRFLQHVDVVEFKGQRVAKLTFSRIEGDRSAIAQVLILPRQQFHFHEELLVERTFPGSITIQVKPEVHFIYIISSRGEFDRLLRDLN